MQGHCSKGRLQSFKFLVFYVLKDELVPHQFQCLSGRGLPCRQLELMNALVKALEFWLYFSLLEKKQVSFTSYSKNTGHLTPGKREELSILCEVILCRSECLAFLPTSSSQTWILRGQDEVTECTGEL